MNEVTLPWPMKELTPNARVHWARLAKAKKSYRAACFWLAKEAKLQAPAEGVIRIEMAFYPPCNRRRDEDNLLASMKSGLDGLADALAVNDSRFKVEWTIQEKLGGMVKVRIG